MPLLLLPNAMYYSTGFNTTTLRRIMRV